MTYDYTDLIAKLHEAAYFSPGCLAEQATDAITEAHALLWFVAHAIGHDPATTPELEVALSERLDRDQERWERAEAENAALRAKLDGLLYAADCTLLDPEGLVSISGSEADARILQAAIDAAREK